MIKVYPSVLIIQRLFVILTHICLAILPTVGQVTSPVIDNKQVEELATKIVEAKSLEERVTLADSNKSLITDELIKQIGKKTSAMIRKSEYGKAEDIVAWLMTIGEKHNNRFAVATGIYYKGFIYKSKGEYEKAALEYENSLKIAEQINNKELVANVLNGIGILRESKSNYTQALDYYQKSLKIREEIGNKEGVAGALNNIAIIYYNQGNYVQALECFTKNLKIFDEIGDKYGVALSLSNIGNVHHSQGNFRQASEYFIKSLKIFDEIGYKFGAAASLIHIGTTHAKQGNFTQALDYFIKSLQIREAIGDKEGISMVLNNIGLIYYEQGDYIQALNYLFESLKIKEKTADKHSIAISLDNIGLAYKEQGDYALALKFHFEGLKIRETLGAKQGVASSLQHLGNIYKNQGDYPQALEYYLKSLKIREEIGDKNGIAVSLISLGLIHYEQRDFHKSLDCSLKAVSISIETDYFNSLWQALSTQGKSYLALNQLDSAQQVLLKSIATVEKLRSLSIGSEQIQQSFFQNKIDPYYAMVSLLIKKNDIPQALSYAERAKGRVILDLLHTGRANLNKSMTAEEVDKDQKLSSAIYSLNAQLSRTSQKDNPDKALIDELKTKLEKARLEYEAFQTSIYVAHPELKIERGEINPLTINDAVSMLDSNSAMLEYVVADDVIYLFVLTKSKNNKPNLQVYTINIKSKDLDKKITDFHQIVGSRNLAVRRPAQDLYSLLLKPAMKQLQGIDRLCIVPDGSLWNLPFQALDDGNKWMTDHFSIYYAPSLSVLSEIQKRKNVVNRDRTELLALGNPKLQGTTVEKVRSWYRSGALEALPHAEEEVKTLGTLYGKDKSKVLVGDAAKEEIVKGEADRYRVVHFATHGILDDKSPLYSRLMLASEDGTKEDGMLEAWEIMKMDLQADMAVLAACETARGKIGAGEGMIGMSWALFVAGVPTTVVSQWKVDSEATSKLMVEFHKNLLAKKSKADALREAALKIKKSEYDHPYYWAGFVIIGNGN
jgi:CHAT domain-containing protein/Tfp pilus assembly protein PilF